MQRKRKRERNRERERERDVCSEQSMKNFLRGREGNLKGDFKNMIFPISITGRSRHISIIHKSKSRIAERRGEFSSQFQCP